MKPLTPAKKKREFMMTGVTTRSHSGRDGKHVRVQKTWAQVLEEAKAKKK